MLISPTASSPSFSAIGEKTGLFFRLNIADTLQGIAAANDAIQEKAGTVAILAINNDWGQNLSKLFSESYAKGYPFYAAYFAAARPETRIVPSHCPEAFEREMGRPAGP